MRFTVAGEALRITEPGEGDRGSLVCARIGKGKGIAGLLTVKIGKGRVSRRDGGFQV